MAREAEMLEFAEQIKPFLREHRKQTEAERRIPQVIADKLIASGVCRMALTRDVGGFETDPVVICQVIEALAWAEASVAWTVWNNALPSYFARFLAPDTRQQIYGDPNTLLASSTRSSGKAVVTDGGYTVSGRWSLVSGCQLAEWLPVMCDIVDNDPAQANSDGPETRLLWVRKQDFQILDTWHVLGLRGTGSHDITIDNLFVPEARCFSWTGVAVDDSAYSRLPIFTTMAAWCGCLCLGVAQAAHDAFREIVETKVQADPTPALKMRDEVLTTIASTEYQIESLRASIHAALVPIRDASFAGDEITPQMRARMWRATSTTAQQSKAVIHVLHTQAGTPALYESSPLERAQRDILAITQHIIMQPLHLANAGRATIGLPVQSPIF